MIFQPSEDIDYEIMSEPEEVYGINRKLNMARRIVEETHFNLFLTGKAGTGKTTFLRRLREDSSKHMAVLAPTGVAAINAQGVTINSFFQIPFTPYIPGKGFVGEGKRFRRFSQNKLKLIKALDLLVIDEISMVRGDVLDGVDSVLRRIRAVDEPFGGVQLLLIGDLRQLSPVARAYEWAMLKEYYNSPYFFDSQALRKAGFVALELTKVYRQSDRSFIELLNRIRVGKVGMEHINALNARVCHDFNPADEEGYIRLTTHNRQADHINEQKMRQLPGECFDFEAEVKGKFPESSYPADSRLSLKVGAQVMFIKNDSGNERGYYNGLLGRVTDIAGEKIYVQPAGRLREIEVVPVSWENISFSVDEETGEIHQSVDGEFLQYPLRPAWAITVHKSQGLTFDKAIINVERSFAPGQTYVALSRCRSMEGMVLGAPLSLSAIITDPVVDRFEQYCRTIEPDETKLEYMRAQYFAHTLHEIFRFMPLRVAFDDYSRLVKEYLVPRYEHLYEKYRDMGERIRHSICDVADKFLRLYAGNSSYSTYVPEKTMNKIQGGLDYFIEELEELERLVRATPRTVNNKQHSLVLLNSRERLASEIFLRKNVLEKLKERTFTPTAYLNIKAEVLMQLEKELADAASEKKALRQTRKRKKKGS